MGACTIASHAAAAVVSCHCLHVRLSEFGSRFSPKSTIIMAAWMLSLSEDEALVRTALKKMPVAEVPELLNELQRGLYRSGDHLPKYLRCLAILLEVKFTYLSVSGY